MAATNHYTREHHTNDPAQHVVLITPNDSTDLTDATRGISFSAAGTLKITTTGGETVVIPSGSLAAGIVHPIEAVRVWSTSTTVTDVVGYY